MPADRDVWLRMRTAFWPGSRADHEREIDAFLEGTAREPLAVLVAERHGRLVGFAELSIRAYAEGCVTDRVAYLEGWWVAPDRRRHGVGRELVEAAERWAIEQGCTELASDAELANVVSQKAHRALGFEDAGTIVCFRKRLDT